MADLEIEEVQRRLASAVPESLGEIVTGWTLIADTITDDGKTATWWIVADGQTDPTTLGHARWVDKRIAAQLMRDAMGDE